MDIFFFEEIKDMDINYFPLKNAIDDEIRALEK